MVKRTAKRSGGGERGGGLGTKATIPRETGQRKKTFLKNCMTHNRPTLQLRDWIGPVKSIKYKSITFKVKHVNHQTAETDEAIQTELVVFHHAPVYIPLCILHGGHRSRNKFQQPNPWNIFDVFFGLRQLQRQKRYLIDSSIRVSVADCNCIGCFRYSIALSRQ